MKSNHRKSEFTWVQPSAFLTAWFVALFGFSPVGLQAQSAPLVLTQGASGTVTVINGFIVGAQVTNGGAGYPQAPWVTVNDATGSNAVIVSATSSAGVVTNLTIKNAGSHYSAQAALAIAPPPAGGNPADVNVVLQSSIADNLRTWTSGTNYPVGGIYTNYAGITFYLMAYPGITNGLGIVWTGLGSIAAPVITNFPVNITNAVTVFTLMNSFDGKLGMTNGSLQFYGDQGAEAGFNVVQGVNIRDHYDGSYQNTIATNIMSLYWGANQQVRLDCQGWMLPAAFFSQRLTNIQMRSYGNEPNGVPVIAAITVRTAGPAATLESVPGGVACSWPSTPTNFVLQSAAALPAGPWSTVTAPAVVANNQYVVTNALTPFGQFFRLVSLP